MSAELQYLAGFFDGEGCLGIDIDRGRPPNYTPKHRLRVSVTNTDLRSLEYFQKEFGGTIHGPRQATDRHAPQWQWVGTISVAAKMLPRLYPYLRQKAAQAWLAMEYLEQRSNRSGYKEPPSEEELALREGYRLALQLQKSRNS